MCHHLFSFLTGESLGFVVISSTSIGLKDTSIHLLTAENSVHPESMSLRN